MYKLTSTIILLATISNFSYGQNPSTIEDRNFVISNIERTTNEMIKETQNLSHQQWHFHPTDTSWSIAQVVEHMGIYERFYIQELRIATSLPPQTKKTKSDTSYINWMAEKKAHITPKQSIPLEFMDGKENLAYFIFGRKHLMKNIEATDDLKSYFTPRSSEPNNMRSIHGLLVIHFGHTDRHLRQIARIKAHPSYPSDQNEILKVMQAESSSYFTRNYEDWQNEWIHDKSSVVAWNNEDGKYIHLRGWKEIDEYFKNEISSNQKVKYPNFNIGNLYIEINGNFAHAIYDEYISNEFNMYSKVPITKMFKKEKDKWKLYSVISFWNREYVLSEEEVELLIK